MEPTEQGLSPATEATSTETTGGRARSLANLRPAWKPGQSGNPSGLAKDGRSAPDHPIRAKLRERLQKRRALELLVDTWIAAACDGDSAAREQILKRLDPVSDESTARALPQVTFELTHSGIKATLGTPKPIESNELPPRLVEALPSEASCSSSPQESHVGVVALSESEPKAIEGGKLGEATEESTSLAD